MFTQMANCTMDTLIFDALFIRVSDPFDYGFIDTLAGALESNDATVTKVYE